MRPNVPYNMHDKTHCADGDIQFQIIHRTQQLVRTGTCIYIVPM